MTLIPIARGEWLPEFIRSIGHSLHLAPELVALGLSAAIVVGIICGVAAITSAESG